MPGQALAAERASDGQDGRLQIHMSDRRVRRRTTRPTVSRSPSFGIRYVGRFAAVAAGVLLASRVLPDRFSIILPAMSPFVTICSAIARRSISFLLLLCLPLVALSLFKRRWFCSYACPTGLVAECAGKLRGSSKSWELRSVPRLAPWIVASTVGGALVGYPLFVWLDPLSIFNGFAGAWRGPVTLLSIMHGTGLLAILGLSIWRPDVWCYRLCPLGFSQDMLGALGHYVSGTLKAFDSRRDLSSARKVSGHVSVNRRLFLAALFGGAVGILSRAVGSSQTAIRPPGADDEDRFAAVCSRCGNCLRACPEHIIQPDLGQTGLAGFLSPVVSIGPGYCSEFCNACNTVCPSGAIAQMSLDAKRAMSIGTAEITRSLCLAWQHSQYCMVCGEYCPYHAIKAITDDGINCPEVDSDICRGCGLCQTVCPAEDTAIIIEGRPQRRLKPVEI